MHQLLAIARAHAYNLIDFTGAGAVHAEAMSMMSTPMMASDSIEIMAGNDLGLINGPALDGKLQDPFTTFSGLEMPTPPCWPARVPPTCRA